ncbi:MAG: FKBP-type peptidyl-prolyl cis-trans isomerase [Paludibacter sp.]|nr:FKBP-type peptidyl-prolyl cis-trans isomerase [Paludibacter sp.]
MKKTILFIAAATLVFTAVEAKNKKKDKAVVQAPVQILVNDVDSMSYALGMNVGGDFAKNLKGIPGGKSNVDLLIKGFSTAMKGDTTLIKPEVAAEYFKNYISKAQAQDAELKKADGEKFLAENKTKEGVQTTASGLQYKVLVAKDGPKPQATDSVKVNYEGFLIDGKKFDSSIDRGEPITFPLNQVIPGWTEGVQLMSVGSKYKFFVPYTLAYGEKGAGNGVIPAYATLVFEIELLDIKPVKEVAPVVDVKPVTPVKAVQRAKTHSVKK